MDITIAGMLAVDGLTNGAIYALLGLATVMVFAVTRVIFIPQGEFVAFGALTLAMFIDHKVPGTVWLLIIMALVVSVQEALAALKSGASPARLLQAALRPLPMPGLCAGLSIWLAPHDMPMWSMVALSLALVTAIGPLLYRMAYQSLESSTPLVLLIVSVGVHFALTGLALLFFGPEGFRNPAFWDQRLQMGSVPINGQAIIIFIAALVFIAALWFFFDKTLFGKALRATAVNRNGARLMGISTHTAGQLTFTLAAFIGALSGLLIGPTTTVLYDSGFLIGLKGFVAAVIAGLASYPGALVVALGVGLVEAFSSFWASAFKEVVVFALILPALWLRSRHVTDDDEEH
jgi:branched-chain amino acid transport system permease protein